jgi:membrane protease YdiL (CAAX protease family)
MSTGVIAPLFFEVSPKSGTDTSDRIAGKAFLAGASIYLLFGPMLAAIAVIAHLAFSGFLEDRFHVSWFAPNHLVEEVKKTAPFFFSVLKVNIIVGIFLKLTKWGGVHQLVLQILLSAETLFRLLKILFAIIVLAPVTEEIIFRGFLQEKLKDVQTLLIGEEAKSTRSKTIRVGLQALAFSACHFHPLQGLFNIPLLLITFIGGSYLGMQKEETGTLWAPMMIHGTVNMAVSLRVLLVGS